MVMIPNQILAHCKNYPTRMVCQENGLKNEAVSSGSSNDPKIFVCARSVRRNLQPEEDEHQPRP